MNNCIFCKIINGDIPSEIIYEDDLMIIFNDIDPKAKLHYLLVPKSHYKLLEDMDSEQQTNLAKCLKKISSLKGLLNLNNGYRLVINQGDDAGQSVFHLHIHIMGGQCLDFPKL